MDIRRAFRKEGPKVARSAGRGVWRNDRRCPTLGIYPPICLVVSDVSLMGSNISSLLPIETAETYGMVFYR